MLESIVTGMLGAAVILGFGLLLKAAFKSDRIQVKNGKRRGDGCGKGIIA